MIEESDKQLTEAKAEVERYRKRDGNATIELNYKDKSYPFNREDLQIADFGVADNGYVVTSPLVESFIERAEKAEAERDELFTKWSSMNCKEQENKRLLTTLKQIESNDHRSHFNRVDAMTLSQWAREAIAEQAIKED
jgi:hypothetical protein